MRRANEPPPDDREPGQETNGEGRDEDARNPGRLASELEETKDQLLRALAEQQNIRRRTERETREAYRFAVADFSRDLLTTVDNLRRALRSVPEELAESPAFRQWLEGVLATERGLLVTFEHQGIRSIEPQGERFDPNLHEAVLVTDAADTRSGTVLRVLQPGFLHNERLLRPALVEVSR